MSVGILKPGCRVRHAVRHQQHDRWEGVVVEIQTCERVSWTTRFIHVRWIKPDGDPSDSLTAHDPSELTPYDPGSGA